MVKERQFLAFKKKININKLEFVYSLPCARHGARILPKFNPGKNPMQKLCYDYIHFAEEKKPKIVGIK